MHILVAIFCRNIQQTLGTHCNLHRALSWAKQEEFFYFFVRIFLGGEFTDKIWNIWCNIYQKNNISIFLVKKYKKKLTESKSVWGRYRWFKISYVVDFFFFFFFYDNCWTVTLLSFFKVFMQNFRKNLVDLSPYWKITKFLKNGSN